MSGNIVNNILEILNDPFSSISSCVNTILILMVSLFSLYMIINLLYNCYNLCSYHTKRLCEKHKENNYSENTDIELCE